MKTLHVVADTIAEGWERAVIETWEQGIDIHTQYDKPGDPPSKDITLMLRVPIPFKEPRIHMGGLCMGFEDLEKYRSEVLYGISDFRIGKDWDYTYHQRVIGQVPHLLKQLKECGYTRRAQLSTWRSSIDQFSTDPPCMQRMWFRILDGLLHMNMHIRSNDAFKAAFPNIWVFTEFQAMIAEQLGVGVGEYVHVADSFHIYGSYHQEFERFLKSISHRGDRIQPTAFAAGDFILSNRQFPHRESETRISCLH